MVFDTQHRQRVQPAHETGYQLQTYRHYQNSLNSFDTSYLYTHKMDF